MRPKGEGLIPQDFLVQQAEKTSFQEWRYEVSDWSYTWKTIIKILATRSMEERAVALEKMISILPWSEAWDEGAWNQLMDLTSLSELTLHRISLAIEATDEGRPLEILSEKVRETYPEISVQARQLSYIEATVAIASPAPYDMEEARIITDGFTLIEEISDKNGLSADQLFQLYVSSLTYRKAHKQAVHDVDKADAKGNELPKTIASLRAQYLPVALDDTRRLLQLLLQGTTPRRESLKDLSFLSKDKPEIVLTEKLRTAIINVLADSTDIPQGLL